MTAFIRGEKQRFGLRDCNTFNDRSSAYWAKEINVYNGGEDNDTKSWIATFCRSSRDSVIVFDENFYVVTFADKIGTFDGYQPVNIDDIKACLDQDYLNAYLFDMAIKDAAKGLACRTFILHMLENDDVICRADPVLEYGKFGGMIVTAWIQDQMNTNENSGTKQKPLTYIIGR